MSEPGQRSPRGLRNVVVVGGGTAGWMAAAALARVLAPSSCEIILVESSADGVPAGADGTIPNLRAFHGLLGIDERDFVRATRATFKLATRFRDWGERGGTFLHPFGPYGIDARHELFQAYWLERRRQGRPSRLEEWSVTGLAASLGRCGARPANDSSPLRHLSYGYHLDAVLYARFLRAHAEKGGVRRIEGDLAGVVVEPGGRIGSLRLRDGRAVDGDFFIDCSGSAALVIAGALKCRYEDWSHWLPCDRAVAIDCVSAGAPAPVMEATALECGWEWRIPLQDRDSSGRVYCSAYLSDDEAASGLLESAQGALPADPRVMRFRAGRRASAWVGNCLALGDAAGFLEPLASTGIHFIQTGLGRLFGLFPDRDFDPAISAEYNRLTALEYERARDFLVLHYAASKRDDATFWRECRAAQPPETMAYKRDLFAKTGRIASLEEEAFGPASWLALYAGLGVWPERPEPAVGIAGARAMASFEAMPEAIRKAVETLPAHAAYLKAIANLA